MDLQVLTAKQAKHAHNAKAILDLAENESRVLTADEEKAHEAEIKALETIGGQIAKSKHDDSFMEELDELTGVNGMHGSNGGRRFLVSPMRGVKSLGQQFVQNKEMATWLQKKSARGNESPTIELESKAILTSDPASGGGLVVPQYDTQIRPLPTPRPRLFELLGQGRALSNLVSTMTETVATNAADAVLEGAAKPESTLNFAAAPENVRKIATLIPVSDEMLEDVAQIESYIDARLIGFVRAKLDAELLSGSGVAPHLLGLMNRTLAADLPQGTMSAVDAIGLQIATLAVANEDLYLPDAVIVNPLDLTKMLQMKTSTKEYIAASPFEGTTSPTLWGLPVIPMSGMTAGTALVGAFRTAAQVFLRGPIETRATNSHQDWFQKNLWAIVAEVRSALAVYRGQAFGRVTGITFPVPTE